MLVSSKSRRNDSASAMPKSIVVDPAFHSILRLSTGQLGMNDLGTLYVLLAGIIDPARKLSSTYAKLKRASAAGCSILRLLSYSRCSAGVWVGTWRMRP